MSEPRDPLTDDVLQELANQGEEFIGINVDALVEVDGFTAHEGHVAYLKFITECEITPPLRSIAEAIGVPKSTICDWHHDPGFQDWIASNRERELRMGCMSIYQTLLKEARGGNVAAATAFLRRFDPKFESWRKRPVHEDTGKVSDNQLVQLFMKRSGCTKEQAVSLLAGKAQVVVT